MSQWLPSYGDILRRLARDEFGLQLLPKRLVTRDALRQALRTERTLRDRISHS